MRRMSEIIGKGDVNELVNKSNTIKARLTSTNTSMNTEKVFFKSK